MKLNRIYQGRVWRIQLLDGKANKTAPVEELDPDALMEHHRLFQDAVNYYLVNLASMVSDRASLLWGFRERVIEAWAPCMRKGKRLEGLQASLRRHVGEKAASSIDAFSQAMFADDPKVAEARNLAVQAVAEDLSGDGAIQHGGREYLPRLCWRGYSGRYPREQATRERDDGRIQAARLVHDDSVGLSELQSALQFKWFANPKGDGKFENKEARNVLRNEVEWMTSKQFLSEPKRKRLTAIIESDVPITFPAYRGGSVNKVPLRRRFAAYLIFRYIEASSATLELLRQAIPAPKREKQARTKKVTPDPTLAVDLVSLGDDPVKRARGSRGFVFPAFTALPTWGAVVPGQLAWKEFDIAAFKEALKVLNQFRQATEARFQKVDTLRARIQYMTEADAKWKPSDDDGVEDAPVRLFGDPRYALVQRALSELGVANEMTDGEDIEYGLEERTLRGWRNLTVMWNKKIHEGESFTTAKRDELIAITDKYQTEQSDRIGSVQLFKKFLEQDFWSVWRTPTDAQLVEQDKNHWADDVLDATRVCLEAQMDLREINQPVHFTPADAEHSRRLFMFSDVKPPRHLPGSETGRLCVDVALALRQEGIWHQRYVRLHYTAPRLLRDALRTGAPDEDVARANWLQPMIAALGLSESAVQNVSDCAVALMPDRQPKDGILRYLLNFPVSIDTTAIAAALPQSQRFASSFVVNRDKEKARLRWPEEPAKGRSAVAAPWYSTTNPFTILAVDLGQRSAGAFAVMHVSAATPPNGKPSRLLGQTDTLRWNATLLRTGLLSLPGEDVRVQGKNGWQQEPYGRRGRLADQAETEEATKFLTDLDLDPALWLGTTPQKMPLPEQNDKLLVACRRAFGQLRQCHRWLYFLSKAERRAKALEELQEQDLIPELRTFVESGNIFALNAALQKTIAGRHNTLALCTVTLANRVLPLRGRRWQWLAHPDVKIAAHGCRVLVPVAAPTHRPKLCGMRGLSLRRIEQIEELRKRLQSFNRACMRSPGESPLMGRASRDASVPDCCPLILSKLAHMKEQRVNQTAHIILAEALGVRLCPHTIPSEARTRRDIHGEYERVTGRDPVAFIVIEDLSRYLSSQGRGPTENSRLMKWCHRQIAEKLRMLAEAFNLTVLVTPAAYSSRFCSRTGMPGFRATEVGPSARHDYPWRKWLEPENESEEARCAKDLFAMLDEVNRNRSSRKPERTLLAPVSMGPVFVPAFGPTDRPGLQQADINAAANLALRALASPRQLTIQNKIRTAGRNKSGFDVRTDNNLEKVLWAGQRAMIEMNPAAADSLAKDNRHPNFFVLPSGSSVPFDNAHVQLAEPERLISLASGRDIWKTVREQQWPRCMAINKVRLDRWRAMEQVADDLPM